jgi:hypothetical protein
MNSASEDFDHHLNELRERAAHPTNYEQAVHYFLDEFAADGGFIRACEVQEAPLLVGVLETVVSMALGHPVALERPLITCLREHRFYHGNAIAAGHIVVFFYFQETETGIAVLLRGLDARMEVARFRLPAGLCDPRMN